MRNAPVLHLLCPTGFSAAGRHVGAPIAQLAEVCPVSLTIVHVVRPGMRDLRPRLELESFLARERFAQCERVLVEADDAPAAVAGLCARAHYDLIMAPATGRTGLSRVLSGSFRARMLEDCAVPLWTVGACLPAATFQRPLRTVSCLIDFEDDPRALVSLASTFAERFGARVQAVSVVPPIDDGTLGDVMSSDRPLSPECARERIRALFAGQGDCDIEVVAGTGRRGLRAALARGAADLVFVGARQARAGAWRFGFSRTLDALPCPAVCLGRTSGAFTGWSFLDASRYAFRPAVGERGMVAAFDH
jgi:nucleotide-binding universal stress UspA family protein